MKTTTPLLFLLSMLLLAGCKQQTYNHPLEGYWVTETDFAMLYIDGNYAMYPAASSPYVYRVSYLDDNTAFLICDLDALDTVIVHLRQHPDNTGQVQLNFEQRKLKSTALGAAIVDAVQAPSNIHIPNQPKINTNQPLYDNYRRITAPYPMKVPLLYRLHEIEQPCTDDYIYGTWADTVGNILDFAAVAYVPKAYFNDLPNADSLVLYIYAVNDTIANYAVKFHYPYCDTMVFDIGFGYSSTLVITKLSADSCLIDSDQDGYGNPQMYKRVVVAKDPFDFSTTPNDSLTVV